MTYATWIAVAVIALFALAAWVAIWSRADTRGRSMAVAIFLIGVPSVAAASIETLGWAKPFSFSWEIDTEREYHVLAARLVQDVGIWIWLDTGDPEPRSYRLAWSNETAQAIQEAMDGAPEGREGQFVLTKGESDGEMVAHPLPQRPEPPAKDAPEPGMVYQQE